MISILLFGLVACASIKNENPFASPPQSKSYQTEVAGKTVNYFITSIASGLTLAITEGDIVLGEIPASSVPSSSESAPPTIILKEPFASMDKSKSKRSAFIRRTWPDKTLKYSWGNVKESSKNDLIQAMKDWNRLNGIIFQEVPLGSNENHVEMVDSDGCWSSVGMNGGKQTLGLSVNCRLGAARHELAHALGFIHEQCRPDRDNYIDIHWDRIQKGKEHNFNIWEGIEGDDKTEYDTYSLMQYQSDAFGVDGQATITRKDGSWIRRNDEIAASDVAGMAKAYPSNIEWFSWSEGLFAYNCDDLNHNDIRYIKPMGKSADCGPACNNDGKCTHWVWTGDGTCYLKYVQNASKSTLSLVNNPSTTLVCGLAR
ncbi:hypothetical protein HDV02_006405, partial [Globomyces sp. JEL0801]